jgi:hypothetical protein
MLLVCFVTVSLAKKDDEEYSQAQRDLQTGMAGLKEASNNPALLAQLMRDLQVSFKHCVSCKNLQILAQGF